ncbi:MAG: response regulator [Rhizobiales bacterium]|nr:response regulator [Hyphomicrobiales bacterium]
MTSPAASASDIFTKLRILVVEDSSEMRRLVIALLHSMRVGCILEARDGQRGLEIFNAEKPDIIITDGAMYPMDGYEMTRLVRASTQGNCDIPILMISGHLTRAIVDHARDQGVTDYLAKPLSADLLYQAILRALSKPLHIVETPTYRGPSPTRNLQVRHADWPF